MGSNRSLPFDLPGRPSTEEELAIPDKLYFRISEVSKLTGLEPYVLRYWETEFKLIKPVRTKSRHPLYKRKDLDVIFEIKRLLYEEQYTIAGAKKKLDGIMKEEKSDIKSISSVDTKAAIVSALEELKAIRKMLS